MSVFSAVIVIVTLAVIGWALWARRITWSSRRDSPATLAIALLGLSLLLVTPVGTVTVGRVLQAVTHLHNLDFLLGHICAVIAAGAMAVNALDRLYADDDELQESFTLWIERPVAVGAAGMFAAFWMGGLVSTDHFYEHSNAWVTIYWVVLTGLLIYLLCYACRALLIIRQDERQRRVANLYLITIGAGVLSCIVRVVHVLPIDLNAPPMMMRLLGTAWLCGFALAAMYSWRQRTREFQSLGRVVN